MSASFPSINPVADAADEAKPAGAGLIGGRYRLVRKLGEGGMAQVWLAVHEALKQEVAVKFATAPEPYGMVPELLARFRFEAQVSARLGERTRHIVAVHDAGVHQAGERRVPFLVMEYVRGTTLAQALLAEGPMPPERFADVLDQLADALGAAHALGIVHRDLKPSNLMLALEPDGGTTVKLADFGIAKAVRKDLELDRPKETALGLRVGSPAYMSPEQAEGNDEVGIPSDLWTLGVVAYEALTGHDAFQGRTQLQLFDAICTGRFDRATTVRMELPRALDAWFQRALAVEPAKRFSSADEMARSFRAALARPARRRWPRVVALAALAVSGVLAALAVVATAGARRAPAPAPTASASAPTPVLATAAPTVPVASPSTSAPSSDSASPRSPRGGGRRPVPPPPAPTVAVVAPTPPATPVDVPPPPAPRVTAPRPTPPTKSEVNPSDVP